MPTAEVHDFGFAVFTVHSEHDACRAQQSKALRLVEVRTGDVKLTIALSLLALEEIVREIVARYGKRNLGCAGLYAAGMGCGHYDWNAGVSHQYGVGIRRLGRSQCCEVRVLVEHGR